MAEHPDSLWQPYPHEVWRAERGRPDDRSSAAAHRAGRPGTGTSRAVEILERRYARGEIGRRELEERRTVLRGAGN